MAYEPARRGQPRETARERQRERRRERGVRTCSSWSTPITFRPYLRASSAVAMPLPLPTSTPLRPKKNQNRVRGRSEPSTRQALRRLSLSGSLSGSVSVGSLSLIQCLWLSLCLSLCRLSPLPTSTNLLDRTQSMLENHQRSCSVGGCDLHIVATRLQLAT